MTIQFSYNQDYATKAGNSMFINETGAYVGKITTAKYTAAQSGALALEFSLETDEGMRCDYISVFYQGKQGEELQGGRNMIHAIMGCANVKQLTMVKHNNDQVAPELIGKRIGFMLQKVLYTKNNGQDGYRFQLLCPFSADSRKTLAEHIENKPAERIDYLVQHTQDKDDRVKQPSQSGGQPHYDTPPVSAYDDDLPPW